MEGTKPWYQSKGVWGGLIAVISAICSLIFGYDIDKGLQQQLITNITAIVSNVMALIGGFVAIYGRIKANKKIEGGN